MTNKSSKSPSGEDREHNEHIRKEGVEQKDVKDNVAKNKENPSVESQKPASASSESRRPKQENLQNRGIKEDQPDNPVRTTGSTKKDQETLPTGEPDPGEV